MGNSETRAKRKYAEKHYKQCNMKLKPELLDRFTFIKEYGGFESYPETLEAALNALSSRYHVGENGDNDDNSSEDVKKTEKRDVTISFVNESLEAAVKDMSEWRKKYFDLKDKTEENLSSYRENLVLVGSCSSLVTILLLWLAIKIF